MIFLALLLPMLSLLPLGWLWLWERGWALYWVGAAFTLSILSYTVQAITLRRTLKAAPEPVDERDQVAPDPSWTAREQAAHFIEVVGYIAGVEHDGPDLARLERQPPLHHPEKGDERRSCASSRRRRQPRPQR